jgi:hypothetical protein
MSDGSTFEAMSIEDAEKEIKEGGGEDKDTFFEQCKDTLLTWWDEATWWIRI